jgi:hypothetical protein
MRKRLLLLVTVAFALCTSFDALAQSVTPRKNRTSLPGDIERALQLIESLRPMCAKPKDAFESVGEARSRVLEGFQPRPLLLEIRPQLVREDDNSTPTTRRWGGMARGAIRYDPIKQELVVRFPYEFSPRLSIYRREDPFWRGQSKSYGYALLKVAEEGLDLGQYSGANAFGVSVQVSSDKATYWFLAFLRPRDLERMRPPEFDSRSGAPELTLPLPPDGARDLTPHLAWRIESRVVSVPEADCIVEHDEYPSRLPRIDNPWHQKRFDLVAAAELVSLALVDRRSQRVIWQAPPQ